MTQSTTPIDEALAIRLHDVLETSFRGEVNRIASLIVGWLQHGSEVADPVHLARKVADMSCGEPSCLPAIQLAIADIFEGDDPAPPAELKHRLVEFLAELARAFHNYEATDLGPRLRPTSDKSSDWHSEFGGTFLFLQHVIDNIADPIFVKDRHHRWVLMNDAFCDIMGYPREQLLGKSDYAFIPEEQADVFWERDDHVFETGEPDENEEHFTDPDGVEHILITKKQMFIDADGQKYLVGAIHDVTEKRRLEARLSVARRLMSLGTLAGGVSHEINNPLSFVISNLEYLKDAIDVFEESRHEIKKALEATLRGARRVREIVDGLATFSQSADETPQPVDLRKSLQSTVEITAKEIKHRARLVEDYHEVPLIEGNHRSLGQIFLNLLTNAIQAIDDSEAEDPEICVRTTTDPDGCAVVEVSDTGTGIPEDVKDHIFDPFFTTKPVGEGTGLGLAICHSLVEAMNGHIEVDTTVGEGTTFRLVFPPADRPFTRKPKRTSPPSRAPDSGDTRPRVLFVDDEPDFLRATERRLKKHFDVHCASSAEEAIEALTDPTQCFDLVVSDVMMPDMNGRQLYEKLAEVAPRYRHRLAFVSGGVFDAHMRRFLSEQDRPVLDKFFNADDLYDLVD